MMPGKMLQRFLPKVNTGTHCSVNYQAHVALTSFDTKVNFPHWREINAHEGIRGIDGLSLWYDVHLPSRSAYNPMTKQGSGIDEVWSQFKTVQDTWITNPWALPQRLAFLSHVITDVCTPSHHFGELIGVRKRRWFGLWPVHDDWFDNSWQHFLFETSIYLRLLFKPNVKATLQNQIIEQYRQTIDHKDFVQSYMQQTVEHLYGHGVFRDFNQFGWTARVDEVMRQVVMPKIVSTVATLWYMSAPTNVTE